MTLTKILDKLERLKPHALTDAEVADFVNELEKDIAYTAMRLNDDEEYVFVPASTDTPDVELLAPDQFEKIYFEYVSAKIDFLNSDIQSYSLTSNQFNSTYSDLSAYCIREGISNVSSSLSDYF